MLKNLKPFVLHISVAILFVLTAYLFFFSNGKIVYIDSGKLLTSYKGMIEARKEYDKKNNVWKANIDTLTKDVQDAIKKHEKTLALGSATEKELSKELIRSKQKELLDYQNAIRQNAGEEEARLNQQVLGIINAFLTRYGKKHGYKMILIAANGNIAYADPSMEITDKVVEELNKEYAVPVK